MTQALELYHRAIELGIERYDYFDDIRHYVPPFQWYRQHQQNPHVIKFLTTLFPELKTTYDQFLELEERYTELYYAPGNPGYQAAATHYQGLIMDRDHS